MSVTEECQNLQTVIMELQHKIRDMDYMEALINMLEGWKLKTITWTLPRDLYPASEFADNLAHYAILS